MIRDEAVRYMDLPAGERHKLTPDECGEAAVVLAQWAAHVSRACQREEADAEMLAERITEVVRLRLNQQNAYSPQERRALAIAEDSTASRLELQRVAAHVKARRLAYHANRIDRVSRAYEALANARKRERQYGG
jgi:hypothetical protein